MHNKSRERCQIWVYGVVLCLFILACRRSFYYFHFVNNLKKAHARFLKCILLPVHQLIKGAAVIGNE